MEAREAAELIDAMARSLRDNPSQFQISIKVIGQQISSSGGTGMVVNVTGGGPGSRTIGNSVSMGGATVQLSQGMGVEGLTQQVHALADQLTEMAAQLRSGKADVSGLKGVLRSLQGTWVPAVIISVLEKIVNAAAS